MIMGCVLLDRRGMDGSFSTAAMFFPLRERPWHLLWVIWEVRKGNDVDSYKTSERKWNSNHVIKTVFSGQRLEAVCECFPYELRACIKREGGAVASWRKGNGCYIFGQHHGRNKDEPRQGRVQNENTYKSTLLHMQVMEEAYLWEHASPMRGRAS